MTTETYELWGGHARVNLPKGYLNARYSGPSLFRFPSSDRVQPLAKYDPFRTTRKSS